MERVRLGEEGLPRRVDGAASGAEALPQLLAHRLREARAARLVGLPALEELVELAADLLPVHLRQIAGGDRLGGGHDRLALGDGAGEGRLQAAERIVGELARLARA